MRYVAPILLVVGSSFVADAEEPGTTNREDAGRWSKEKANAWYAGQPWPCGFNYVPANAIAVEISRDAGLAVALEKAPDIEMELN